MKPALLLLPLLLAGCAMPSLRGQPTVPLTPEQQACRTEARNSDAVREIRQRWAPGVNDRFIEQEVGRAEESAYRACLRARRLPGPSGVEAPR